MCEAVKMNSPLDTPFGKIHIERGGEPVEYELIEVTGNKYYESIDKVYVVVVKAPNQTDEYSVSCYLETEIEPYDYSSGEHVEFCSFVTDFGELAISTPGESSEYISILKVYCDIVNSGLRQYAKSGNNIIFGVSYALDIDFESEDDYRDVLVEDGPYYFLGEDECIRLRYGKTYEELEQEYAEKGLLFYDPNYWEH